MENNIAYFIGGPSDMSKMVLKDAPMRYKVAQLAPTRPSLRVEEKTYLEHVYNCEGRVSTGEFIYVYEGLCDV